MQPDDLIDGGVLRESDLEGEPPAPAAEVGPFGRYVLLEELGRGGAAIVYRALDPLLNRELALKKLRFGDRELESRFLREAELLARLSHSGIIPVFDFGREGDAHYYTMPLAPGQSLDKWILDHRPDAAGAAKVVRQVGEALAHAHEHGVLHRDVKPANILVSGEGAPLLADFGLGRIEESGQESGRVTETGEVMGTPSYMAPELATRDLKHADARCDVYALGATLYEVLTGAPPFVGASALEILKRVTSEEPVPPRHKAPSTPADLEIICLKALEKDPARRYQTVRDMSDDLARFLAGEPIKARRATLVYRTRRYVARRRAILSVAALGLIFAAGMGISYVIKEARRWRVSNYLREAAGARNTLDVLLREHSEEHPDVIRQRDLALSKNDLALALDLDYADTYYERGVIHALMFEKEEARRNYSLAIQKGPVVKAHLERAILDSKDILIHNWRRDPQDPGRIETLRKGIRSDLEAFAALSQDRSDMEFANALLDMSSLDENGFRTAAAKLESYSRKSRDWRAFYWKGVAEMESKQPGKAKLSLETALKTRPRTRASADLHDRLGGVCEALKLREASITHFRKAIELDDSLITAKVNLASMLMATDQLDESIQWCDVVLKRDGTHIRAHAVRAQSFIAKYELEELKGNAGSNRHLLEQARLSLKRVLHAFPKGSEQEGAIRAAWDFVLKKLEF